MPDEMPSLDEVKRIAEKFIQSHRDIDINKQKIETSHVERSSSDELGQYYEVKGKVRNRYESSSGFGDTFDGFFSTKKAGTKKECSFKLKISSKGGKVIDYIFEDIEPYQHVVDMSATRESLRTTLASIDNSIRKNAETDLLREIKEDIRDRRKRRKRII